MAGGIQRSRGQDRGLHVDRLLAQILKERGSPGEFHYNKIFGAVPVDKLSDLIGRINPDNQITLHEAQPMGVEGLLDRVGFSLDAPLRYELQTFGLEAVIPTLTADTADDIFDFAQRQGAFVSDRIRMRLEYAAIVQTLRSPGTMTFNYAQLPTQRWSARTSPDSYPIEDILTWTLYVRQESNRPIHRLYMTEPVWLEFQQHPTTLARRDVTTWGVATVEVLEKVARLAPGTILVDQYGIYKAPSLTGLGSKRYFGGPDVIITTGGAPSRSDNAFGHMYHLGGSSDDPSVTLRYPEYRVPRFADIIQVTALVHFLVEEARSAFLALGVVDAALAKYRSMLSS